MKKVNTSETSMHPKKAEESLKKKTLKTASQQSEFDTMKLINELEVHQIELELQNEELILARSAAKETAEKYAELYDFAPSGYFTLSREGKIIELNLCGAKMLGKERSRLKNSLFGFFVSGNTKPIFNIFLGKVFDSKAKETCDVTLSINGNLPVYVHLTAIVTENGQQCILTAIDITEHKQAEQALKKSEEKYKRLVELSTDSIVVHTEGKIVFANNATLNLLGANSLDEIIGKSPLDFVHPDYTDTAVQIIKKIYDNEEKSELIYEKFVKLNGDIIDVEVTAIPILDDLNTIIGVLGIQHEISGRRREEEDIQKLNEELEQKVIERTALLTIANKELESFSYSVSHDLRAPLRHISGYVDLLTKLLHDSLPEKGKHYLDTIADSTHQMGVLIDDLLQFSRNARLTMQQANLDMNDVLHEAMNTMGGDISDRSIKWVIATLPYVFGDYNLLRLVWINLLSNAVKFTRPKKKTRIEIGFREENKEFIFFVRDNGVGFDMQYANKLFGVFQRLHTSEEFEGTGIGLANVRRIILRHGGRTWVDAVLNKGATFYFTLPKNKENEP